MKIDNLLVAKVLNAVDRGLVQGMGVQEPGKMCVEAAVCYALGLSHSDNPPCVGAAVRSFKIALNDASWSSDQARARGMRRVAVAQLGSRDIDQQHFAELVAIKTTQQILPISLRFVGLEKEAKACEDVQTLDEAHAASAAAYAAAYAYAAAAAARAAAAYAAAAGDGDKILSLSAEIAVQALIECGAEGAQFLHMCD